MLLSFPSFLDHQAFPIMKKVEKVVYWKHYAHKVENQIKYAVNLSANVSNTRLKKEKGPGKCDWKNDVDNISEYHVPFLVAHHNSHGIVPPAKREKIVEQKNQCDIRSQNDECSCVTGSHIGCDSEKGRSISVGPLVTEGSYIYLHSKDGKQVLVELFIN